jgi:formylglycine-generating enzyme required for sulfatase activity
MGCDESYPKGGNLPAIYITYGGIKTFLGKLNQMTGKKYRMPTESEWEYACHGGSQTEYSGGNNIDAVAWYQANSGGQLKAVGLKQANGYGLYDMSGNVWELTEENVIRGGSHHSDPWYVRAASRIVVTHGAGSIEVGFRLARTLP